MSASANLSTTQIPVPGFETTFITRNELADDQLKALQDKLNAVVGNFGGELIMNEDWGKRRMSYPIEKETRGQYNFMVYTGKGDIVHEIERNLRLHDHVLRFLSISLGKEFNGDDYKKHREDMKAAAKKREEEREARREERAAERRAAMEQRGGGRGHDRDHGDDGMNG